MVLEDQVPLVREEKALPLLEMVIQEEPMVVEVAAVAIFLHRVSHQLVQVAPVLPV
jgi:hypothetical protein